MTVIQSTAGFINTRSCDLWFCEFSV